MVGRLARVLLPAGLLLGGALIVVAALLATSASDRLEVAGAQVCEGDTIDLVEGCNPLASTYPDGTSYETLAACVSPPDILVAIWTFDAPTGIWRACAPNVPPEVCNFTNIDFLGVVFICVNDNGTWTRPTIPSP